MFIESQKLLEILQYICSAGLIIPGLAVFIISDPRKKVASLFIMFIFITVLSFVFYAGIVLFIANMVFVFVFAVLYMLARETAGRNFAAPLIRKKHIILKMTGYAAALVFCCALGYIIFFYISKGSLPAAGEGQEIFIASLEELSTSIFGTYSIVIIIIIAAVLMTLIGFILYGRRPTKDRGV